MIPAAEDSDSVGGEGRDGAGQSAYLEWVNVGILEYGLALWHSCALALGAVLRFVGGYVVAAVKL